MDAPALAVRIREANWDLGAHVRRDPALAGMATTFTAVWFSQRGTLLLAHTGDSRAYLLRGGELMRQTRDDSFVQTLVEQGLVRAEDAMTHPRRNIITASLRGDATDLVRVAERVPVRGDRWMICSDGVSDYLPDDAIADVLRGPTCCAVPATRRRRQTRSCASPSTRDRATTSPLRSPTWSTARRMLARCASPARPRQGSPKSSTPPSEDAGPDRRARAIARRSSLPRGR